MIIDLNFTIHNNFDVRKEIKQSYKEIQMAVAINVNTCMKLFSLRKLRVRFPYMLEVCDLQPGKHKDRKAVKPE